jgi:hypothetical protein
MAALLWLNWGPVNRIEKKVLNVKVQETEKGG